jgi:hypothetical protein
VRRAVAYTKNQQCSVAVRAKPPALQAGYWAYNASAIARRPPARPAKPDPEGSGPALCRPAVFRRPVRSTSGKAPWCPSSLLRRQQATVSALHLQVVRCPPARPTRVDPEGSGTGLCPLQGVLSAALRGSPLACTKPSYRQQATTAPAVHPAIARHLPARPARPDLEPPERWGVGSPLPGWGPIEGNKTAVVCGLACCLPARGILQSRQGGAQPESDAWISGFTQLASH